MARSKSTTETSDEVSSNRIVAGVHRSPAGDKDSDALINIISILQKLDPDARERVLRAAKAYYEPVTDRY